MGQKELPGGKKVGSLGMGISHRELMEPPGGDKVSLGRVVSLGETLFPGTMMSPGLDTALQGEENGGSPGSVGVAFPMKGGGWVPGSSLFLQVGCGNREDVGVPGGRCGAWLKKKNRIRASGLGARV
jgi:hypothetical protein